MIGVNITYEGKNDLKAIQKKFQGQLSDKEIQKTTAFAINQTANRVAGFVGKEIKKEYNIKSKYLKRVTQTTKKAKGTQSGLYAEISHNYSTIPIIAFEAKDTKTQGVVVSIKKGKQISLKKMFIRTMKSGHTGVFARGKYYSGKFKPHSDKKITEIKTASPFTMATNKDIRNRLAVYVNDSMPKRLEALLQIKLKKLSNK